jgi:LacI family transcriptional regulator
MATIRDVAERAGVAISTVSAALNRSGRVSEKTRQRVAAAAAAVGYVPNMMARSLKSGSSPYIGFVVGDLTNPYLGAVLRVIERAATAGNFTVVVSDTDDDVERERVALDLLASQHVAGIIINPVGNGETYRARLAAMPLPLVLLDQLVEGLDRDFVGMDSLGASQMLTSYLLRLGHRHIAFVGGRPGLWSADMRLRGFCETMQHAGARVNPAWCVAANFRGELAYNHCIAILSGQERPTAILAANNVMALGALQAINDLGFRCPYDISLVSIDDVPWSGVVKPRLTIVAQPIEEISRIAIEWLLERIARGPKATLPRREAILPPRLIVGDSCADLRNT